MVKAKTFPVVVTTAHRGVFFGYATTDEGTDLLLERARMCLYWHESVRGVFGLAVSGPRSATRVGPEVTRLRVQGVVSVAHVTPEAEAAWLKAGW